MQGKSTNIKFTNHLYLSLKPAFKYCLFVLFAFAFSLQQFSASAYMKLAESTRKDSGSTLQVQHSSYDSQPSYDLPLAPNPLAWEIECLEEEEENNNKKISLDDCRNHLSKTHSSDEIEYTSSLKSRYFQLTCAVSKRPSIPFFLLYQSWKSYLS